MRNAWTLAILLALVPTAVGEPKVQVSPEDQTGSNWSEYHVVAVQAGTGYILRGIAGDHDIHFYDAGGRVVGWGEACGGDAGIVPASAVSARILIYDHDGQVFPCQESPLDALPSSRWVYVDGL